MIIQYILNSIQPLRGLFVTLSILTLLTGCQTGPTGFPELPSTQSQAQGTQVEFTYGPFNDAERANMSRVGIHAAPLQTDRIIFEVVKDNQGSSASSVSHDDGVTIYITFEEDDFLRMSPEMVAFAIAHEMGHWDDQIRFGAANHHELEHACDFWALLALEELGDINLRKAVSFFKVFDYPEYPTHPSSASRYAKLISKIQEWERYDKIHPGRTEAGA